jgi:hypothetical protein
MNAIIAAVGTDSVLGPSVGVGGGGLALVAFLSLAGLIFIVFALRSLRRAPVYVVRDFGRRF